MIAVSWGPGYMALVDDGGKIVDASSKKARADIERVMTVPVTRWLPGEYIQTINPGEPEFVRAALESLDGATVTV